MTLNDRIYWNERKYGSSFIVPNTAIKMAIITTGIIIPVVIPFPLTIYIACKVKNNWRISK